MNCENCSVELVCAGEEEEFFYKDSDLAVKEGDPVGVDISSGGVVHFKLFEDIYWSTDALDVE